MRKLVLFLPAIVVLVTSHFAMATYLPQTGDLIFHKSLGRQAKAIAEAQESDYTHMGVLVQEGKKWYVFEAVQPVSKTEVTAWVKRGKNSHFVIKRLKPEVVDMSSRKLQTELVSEMYQYFGLDYDIFFQWSDGEIYCSELAYKAYQRALGVTVGGIQKIGDLNLTGPNVKKLIEEREKLLGRPVDMNEPIITPVAMMTDPNLETIATDADILKQIKK